MMKTVRDICSSYDWIESYSLHGSIQTVLSHNDDPTSVQATSIASSKEYIDLAHDRITQDIDNLEKTLELLRARRHALNRCSVQHAGALSTFRRLPDEILLEIFLHACGDERFRVGCQNEGPWKLRAVCRKWGRIVEGCSQLWCNMVIDLGHDDVCPAAFAQALQFCGSRPIHMKLSVNEHYSRVRRSFRGLVLDTIISSSPMWETLIVESNGYLIRFALMLFPRLAQNLPLLRSFKFQGAQHGDIESLTSRTLPALLTAPALESVHMELDSVRIAQLLDIVPIPCQQIRQLLCYSIEHEPTVWHGHLLLSKEKFPLLEHCIFISAHPSTRSANKVSASIRVKHDGVVHLVTSQTDVLDSFSFPSLRTLFNRGP
ncbi:hypothetical protein BDZ89DRAFT_142398 [Hymenopellis radicata]|nr:hypothetical protein BDZ89DRAFT_142398 [Hymenopellis radicata]